MNISGDYLHLTSDPVGFRCYNIHDPHNITLAGYSDFCETNLSIEANNNIIYLAGNSFHIFDCSESETPRFLSNWSIFNNFNDICIQDTLVYLACYGLVVMNVSDIEDPRSLVYYNHGGWYNPSIDIGNNQLFMAAEDRVNGNGLYIIDISNPRIPGFLTYYQEEFTDPRNVYYYSPYIYLLSQNTLSVHKIDHSGDIETLSTAQLPGAGRGLTEKYGRALVSDGEGGMRIVDVSNPMDIQEVGNIETGSINNCAVIFGNYTFIAAGECGLRIFNIEDPSDPDERGYYETESYANDIVFDNYRIYLVEEGKLNIYDCSACVDYTTPPIWVDYPHDTVAVFCGDWVRFEIGAEDPNEEDSLRFAVTRGAIPDSANLVLLGNNRCRFEWLTGDDDQGFYNPMFYVTDGIYTRTITVYISVVHINFRPDIADKPMNDIIITEGDTVEFDLRAFDPNEDSLYFRIIYHRLPDWVEFTDNHDGTAHFRWITEFEDRGTYRPSFVVSDGEKSDTCTVTIIVNPLSVDQFGRELPQEFDMLPPLPNPFNASTYIPYKLPCASHVSIKVFAITGREVDTLVDRYTDAGEYLASWHGINAPAGLYFCRMEAEGFRKTRKLILMK